MGKKKEQEDPSFSDELKKTFDSVKERVSDVPESVKQATDKASDIAKEGLGKIGDAAAETGARAKERAQELGSDLQQAAGKTGEIAKEGFDTLKQKTTEVATQAKESISDVPESVKQVADKTSDIAKEGLSKIGDAAAETGARAKELGSDLQQAAGKTGELAKEGFDSLKHKTADAATHAKEGVHKLGETAAETAAQAKERAQELGSDLQQAADKTGELAKEGYDSLKQKTTEAATHAKEGVHKLGETAAETAAQAKERAQELGSDLQQAADKTGELAKEGYDSLKHKTAEAATHAKEGVHKLGETAAETSTRVKESAQELGSGLQQAADKTGELAKEGYDSLKQRTAETAVYAKEGMHKLGETAAETAAQAKERAQELGAGLQQAADKTGEFAKEGINKVGEAAAQAKQRVQRKLFSIIEKPLLLLAALMIAYGTYDISNNRYWDPFAEAYNYPNPFSWVWILLGVAIIVFLSWRYVKNNINNENWQSAFARIRSGALGLFDFLRRNVFVTLSFPLLLLAAAMENAGVISDTGMAVVSGVIIILLSGWLIRKHVSAEGWKFALASIRVGVSALVVFLIKLFVFLLSIFLASSMWEEFMEVLGLGQYRLVQHIGNQDADVRILYVGGIMLLALVALDQLIISPLRFLWQKIGELMQVIGNYLKKTAVWLSANGLSIIIFFSLVILSAQLLPPYLVEKNLGDPNWSGFEKIMLAGSFVLIIWMLVIRLILRPLRRLGRKIFSGRWLRFLWQKIGELMRVIGNYLKKAAAWLGSAGGTLFIIFLSLAILSVLLLQHFDGGKAIGSIEAWKGLWEYIVMREEWFRIVVIGNSLLIIWLLFFQLVLRPLRYLGRKIRGRKKIPEMIEEGGYQIEQ